MRDIHMVFPGVHALKGVHFDLFPGEVHALVGENGAGKSTLIKILSGVNIGYSGKYLIDSQPANINSPADAIRNGISVIYQELNMAPSLSVAENIFFGRLPSKYGRVLWRQLYQETKQYTELTGLRVNPRMKLQYLSVAQTQLTAISKAISLDSKIIIMDEPTSALSPNEITNLFRVIGELKKKNVAIVYVSHKLDEIFTIADRVSVFKDGSRICTKNIGDINQQQLIEMMVGRKMSDLFPKKSRIPGEMVLDVRALSTDKVYDITFNVREGEIVGFSGLMGSGRTEMTRALFGVDRRKNGSIKICGQELPPGSPYAAGESGMGLVVENRREDGIFPGLSVKVNMTIASMKQMARGIHILRSEEKRGVDEMIDRMNIKTPSAEQWIAKLSGGNQQKVLLARWLMKKNLKVLIVDEPTRGIDVGAKSEIYALLDELAKRGLALVMVSSELPEILGMCDRIYVMKNRRITSEFSDNEASETALLEKAII
jgi:ABC-type sugar transport system ATPase subunit